MTKDPNPGFFIFPFFVRLGGGGGGGLRAGQGKGRCRQGGAIIFICYVTHCTNLIHIVLRLHKDIP